jgi:hypothetical protein
LSIWKAWVFLRGLFDAIRLMTAPLLAAPPSLVVQAVSPPQPLPVARPARAVYPLVTTAMS